MARGRKHSFRDISLPPLSLSGGGYMDSITEMFSVDNLKEIAIFGLVGAGATVAANLAVRNLAKIPTVGTYVQKFGPLVPVGIGLASRRWLTPRYPRLSMIVQGVAFGAAVYTTLDMYGVFQKTGLAGLMGDDGLAADIYLPELVGLNGFPVAYNAYGEDAPVGMLSANNMVYEGDLDDGSQGDGDLGEIGYPSQFDDENGEPGYAMGEEGEGALPEDMMGNVALAV